MSPVRFLALQQQAGAGWVCLALVFSQENLCVLSSIPVPWSLLGFVCLPMGKGPKDPSAVGDVWSETISVKCNCSF